MSFTPAQLAAAIQDVIPDFLVDYTPDFRDDIARTWPESIDDSCARRDWGWQPRYDLRAMVQDMIDQLGHRFAAEELAAAKSAAAAAAASAGGAGGSTANGRGAAVGMRTSDKSMGANESRQAPAEVFNAS